MFNAKENNFARLMCGTAVMVLSADQSKCTVRCIGVKGKESHGCSPFIVAQSELKAF